MRAYVDKIEGGRAELRLGADGAIALVLPLAELPAGLQEGDVLAVTFRRDTASTHAEVAENARRRDALLDRSKQEPF